jgi:cytochrome o ubiquinol oxidase operon protein cyoD
MRPTTFTGWLLLYVVGFGLSLILSVAAYLIIAEQWFGDMSYLATAVLLAVAAVQMAVQLYCFLHLGSGPAAHTKTQTFLFTLSTLLIVVVGSLWIMHNLDYRMGMSPKSMIEYMLRENQKGF